MATTRRTASPPRDGFALTGPSRPLDPRHDAVRPDIADVRLADKVFAPHYAAPLPRALVSAATLRVGPEAEAEELAQLSAGDVFEWLDHTGDQVWGIAVASGLVGYLDARAVGL